MDKKLKKFTDPIGFYRHPTIKGAKVTKDAFIFWWSYSPTKLMGQYVIIPAGTITNGPSIPWFLLPLWALLPASVKNAWLKSFIMHDRMTAEFGQSIPKIMILVCGQSEVHDHKPSWATAAKWMKRGIETSKKWTWVRYPLWHAVRLWGNLRRALPWSKYNKSRP